MVVTFLRDLKSYIEKQYAVSGVELHIGDPLTESSLADWERRERCQLPKDFHNFYLSANGFSLIWTHSYFDTNATVGRIEFSSIENLRPVQFELVESDSSPLPDPTIDVFLSDLTGIPELSNRTKMYTVEQCGGNSSVLLLCGTCMRGIYFVDRDFSFHWLCSSLEQYFRLAVAHLGILDWQTLYTPNGPTPETTQYLALYAAERLTLSRLDAKRRVESSMSFETQAFVDPARLQQLVNKSAISSKLSSRHSASQETSGRKVKQESARMQQSALPLGQRLRSVPR